MSKRVVIVGGGAAGWLTAAYLGEMLGCKQPGGVALTVIESPDIGILGVGEGTVPSLLPMLQRIGVDEGRLIRECDATFKQGIRFDHWLHAPDMAAANASGSHYFHAFQSAQRQGDIDLATYWMLGCAGANIPFDAAVTYQTYIVEALRAPKTAQHPSFQGPMQYAYHLDAIKFAHLLRNLAKERSVRQVIDTVDHVLVSADGSIAGLQTRDHGTIDADLYIDCTGFHAQLIGAALKIPYVSCRDVLLCDRAVAIQVPHTSPNSPLPPMTIATAQEAGWTWDIGLEERRGVGYVYSSAHTDDAQAERLLRGYVGQHGQERPVRQFSFDPGYRQTHWVKNCVAVGLAGGFFEPLEATGISMVQEAAKLIDIFFPWNDDLETSAKQFNRLMIGRYQSTIDFLKLHYCLTQRTDSDFWRDNSAAATVPDSLQAMLQQWRCRPPAPIDIDAHHSLFSYANWQFVLYGMGFKTDLSRHSGIFPHRDVAAGRFSDIRRQTAQALQTLPDHRALLRHIKFPDDSRRPAAAPAVADAAFGSLY